MARNAVKKGGKAGNIMIRVKGNSQASWNVKRVLRRRNVNGTHCEQTSFSSLKCELCVCVRMDDLCAFVCASACVHICMTWCVLCTKVSVCERCGKMTHNIAKLLSLNSVLDTGAKAESKMSLMVKVLGKEGE